MFSSVEPSLRIKQRDTIDKKRFHHFRFHPLKIREMLHFLNAYPKSDALITRKIQRALYRL